MTDRAAANVVGVSLGAPTVLAIVSFKVESMHSYPKRLHLFYPLLAVAMAVFLTACGGGGGGNTPSTNPITGILGGVAAVGAPIVEGRIRIICASGSVVDTKTGAAGAWQIGLREQTLPCAVQVSGGTIDGTPNTASYHSVATARGNANATPLTDLMVANLIGSGTPNIWFSGLAASRSSVAVVNPELVTATWLKLRAALPELTELARIHPIATSFEATTGNDSDDLLAALQTAIGSSGITHAQLLSYASVPSFAALPANFSAALRQAYASLTEAN